MTITRVRQPDSPERKAHWSGYPCSGQRCRYGVRNLYRQYAGRGGVKSSPTPEGVGDFAESDWKSFNPGWTTWTRSRIMKQKQKEIIRSKKGESHVSTHAKIQTAAVPGGLPGTAPKREAGSAVSDWGRGLPLWCTIGLLVQSSGWVPVFPLRPGRPQNRCHEPL